MRSRAGTTSLMVTVVIWGTVLGGAVYANLVYFPAYLSDLPASTVVVQGPYGLNERVFWGPAHLAIIVSLIATYWFNRMLPKVRKLIVMSAAIYVGLLVWSIFYFFPELFAFADSPTLTSVSPEEWSQRVGRWRVLAWVRLTLMYVGIVPLLMALVRPSASEA
jgi:hypothetical protein